MTKINMSIDDLKRAVLEKRIEEQLKARGDQPQLFIKPADRHQSLPLSFAQQRLWFISQLDPAASQAYHLPVTLRLTGQLDHHALKISLDRLIARHESLRTRFVLNEGQPCQHIDPADIGFALSYHDLRPLDPALHTQRVAELIDLEAQAPFDFSQGPLIRGQLLQLTDEEHVLLLTLHHIITDGWSVGVLVQELGTFYRAALDGHDDLLPPLPIQYVDYAIWQQEQQQSAAFTEQRDFWCAQLADAPALLTLPTDRPRPKVQTYVGNRVPVHINADLLVALKKLGQRHHTSLFMTVLSAWSLVLARLSGQDDIVIGTPVANRPHHELEGLIGFFVNTLALRVTFHDDFCVADLLAQVRGQALAAYAHQDLPFEQVVEALQPERSLSYNPIFQVMLALNNTPAQELILPGLQLATIPQELCSAHFDLTLSLSETEAGLAGELEYATDLFDTTTIERMVGYLTNVLTAMAADETQLITTLPLLPASERQQLLVDFNATHADFPQEALIHQLFEAQAAQHPDTLAVVCEDQTLSYGELNHRANQLAHYLIALGVRPDDRVAICTERSLDTIVGLLAILKAGGAYVPLDPAYPAERLAFMLDDAAPVVLLTQTTQSDKLHGTVPATVPVIMLDTLEMSLATQPAHNPQAHTLGLTSHHLAYIIYTSGSTGQPKGVMVEHRNVLRLIINSGFADIAQSDCVAHCANVAFDASTWEIWSALLNGARLQVVPQSVLLEPVRFCHVLIKGQVTALWLTAGLFNEYLDNLIPLFGQLRYLLVGGDVLDPSKIQQVQLAVSQPAHLINGYGPTETTTFATTYAITSPVDVTHSIPVGRPIANTQIYILDTHGQPVPVGVTGEIHIAGDGVARGYLNRPELTAERFLVNPFSSEPDARMYRTGDLGRWLPDGNIEYLGRNDFQVKLRGFRIELGEIESRLTQCDGVREAVVIAREDGSGQKQLIAYLRPEEGVELVPTDLRQQLAQHLADYMLPSAFVTLEAFPLTPNGKLDRQALPAPDLSAVVVRSYEAPVGETEIALAQIWQDLLGLEQVGRHDHFFELGGHSLMIVSLIEELRHLGWQLEVRSVFASPVLTDMALAIQHEASTFIVPPNLIPAGCTAITPEMLSLVSLSQSEINTIVGQITGGANNVQDIYPLAPLQEGILFHHLLQTQGDTYLLQSLLAFDSRNRLDSFLDALQQVINRHDILRTSIFWQGLEKPVQVVWRQAPLSVREFTPATMDAIPAQLQAYTDPRQHRINLNHAPLFAADIAHDPVQNEWLLALRFHHLVSDHMTLELILAEIARILQGKTKTLPTMLPYRNFIAQTLSVPAAEHEAYFRAQLADIDEPTAPFGILSVPSDNRAIAEHRLPIDATLAKAIRSQARRLGVSPSILFHVGWAQVLAKTSGRDDVVFGSVLLGRLQGGAGANQILGMFINTLPLRISLNGRTVSKIVQETYHNLTALLEHEQAPLVLAQRCSGVEQPMPLFSTLLNYRHSPSDKTEAVETIWTGIRTLTSEENTNYPITLSVDDLGDGFQLTAQTVTEIAPERITAYLATAISSLIDALVHNPQQRLRDIPILPAAERQQVLTNFNATQTDFPQEALIHQLVEEQAATTPSAIAVVCDDQSLSYEELNRYANRLAHYLIELGVHPDDRVAICVERSLEMVVGLLAILKAGGAYVPLDPAYPTDRLAYMLEDAAPVVLLTQATLHDKLDSTLPVILLDNILNSPEPFLATQFLATQSTDNPDTQALGLTSRHLAYVLYTSGSTGLPKGVMNEHRGVVNRLLWAQEAYQLTPQDRVLQKTPFSFDVSVWEFFLPLMFGAQLVMARPGGHKEPHYLLEEIENRHITTIHFVPSMLQIFLHYIPAGRCLSLRQILCSGEALPYALQQHCLSHLPHSELHNLYGPTEAAIDVTAWKCVPDRHTGQVPIGHPISNIQIYILDTRGEIVPIGVAGEIYIGGVGVARGYLNRPELTAERFVPDPFSITPHARMYKTGDLGRWLPDGNIEYLGRNDFQVKLRGFRIELGEIESRLTQCDGVREAVVLAREDDSGQKRLVAYLRPEEGVELVPADLRQQLTQHLADYMVPSAFVILASFPLTPNGKLDRQALPAPDLSAVVARRYEAPVGETEIALAQIWQKLLSLKQVGRHDHFFELGGHSLMIVSLVEELRQLGWQLEVRSVFASPILTDMALAIQHEVSTFVVPPNRIPEDCTAITPDMLPLVSLSQSEINTIVEQIPGGARHIQDIYPLSPLQEGILFHHLLQTQGDNYLLRSLLAFATRDRLDSFLDALQQIINRHDILRTAIYWQGLEQPVQVVWRQAPLTIREFTPATMDDIPAQLLAHTDPRRHRIDLNHAPLFAADITHDPAQNEWLLALRFHHLVSDHMTLELIFAEIALILQANTEKLPAVLPYRNFIAQTLNTPTAEHEAYFRARLADIDEPTAPFGVLDVQTDNDLVTKAHLTITPDLAKDIRIQARRLGVSPSVLFHVAWAQVLAHTCGRDDVVFGSVLLGRLQGGAGAGQTLGMFINTLPLRISLSGRTVQETVQETYHNLTTLLEHEQAPLVLAQRCSGVEQPMPLFSTLFNYRHGPSGETEVVDTIWAGIRILTAEEHTNYPITLSVDDLGDGFQLTALTVTDIVPEQINAYLATAISGLVDALVHNPQQAIRDIPVLPASERQQLLVDFNATQADFPQEALIHQLFEAQAAQHPEAIAVVFEAQTLSYGELNHRANQLAHYLITLGVRPDDRVALCAERSPEMVIGLLAILKAGGAYVPLDPAYPAERLVYMLEDAAPVALLTQAELAKSEWLTQFNALPTLLLDNPEPCLTTQPTGNPEPHTLGLASRHLAYVIYTSGSTGQPKGVMIEHQSLCNLIATQQPTLSLTADSRVLQFASNSFDASIWECCMALMAGARLCLAQRASLLPGAILSGYLADQAISHVLLSPTALAAMDSLPDTLQTLLVGGEACPPTLVKRWSSGRQMLNAYGPTEITVCATLYSCASSDGSSADNPPPIGRPIANTRIYILDAHGQPVPRGVAGEIYIAGAGVARGYLNRPELTAERFLADPFSSEPDARMYKTGDLGRWLPDGNIEYLGRNDFQVKLRGFRIELGEIESRLSQCDGVREAVVIAREDETGQKQLIAYLRPEEGVELVPADLRQQLAQHLADYMLPSAFVTLEAFPLTPNGKLDRQALPAPDLSAIVTRGYEAPVGETEIALAQIWQDLLGLEQVGRHDHFFELGGHSLLAVQLTARVRQLLARELPLQQLFEQPVLTQLAQTLTNTSTITQVTIPLAERNQPLPLSFAQQRLWFLGQLDPAASLAYHIPVALRLTGRLNRHALTRALDHLVTRHESLRTRVVLVSGQPCQHIDPADIGFALTYQDLRQLDPALHTQRVTELANLEAQVPFDFAQGPLIRGQLLQLADEEHILLLTQHHIISDGWSIGVLIHEISVLYRAILDGQDNPLPPLPIQYADYAVWQREWLQEATLAAQHDFWCTQLAGAPALLTLPTDRPRPAVQTFVGDRVSVRIDVDLLAALKELGQRHNTTLFMTVLSAWSLVLARLSGQDDIVIGTPIANRPHHELEGLIGFFVNTLALRVTFHDDFCVADLLAQVRERALAAYAHQDLPFEQVVEALQPERNLSYSPIFQVMLTLNNTPTQTIVLPEIQCTPVEQMYPSAHFDLTLSLIETEDGLLGDLEYATDLFDTTTIERMVGYLTNVLTAMTADETQLITTLPLLPASECQQLLVDFNATQADFPQEALIHQLFEAQAAQHPEAIAVVFEAQTLSYGELNHRANQLAHYLITLGVRPDDRVALCAERSPEMVIGLLAILKAGGAYVPLDPTYPAERLVYMLEDAAPVALLTQTKLAKSEWLTQFNALPTVLLDNPEPRLTTQPTGNPEPHALGLASRHLAYVIYTSGSTGQPKGVMIEHQSLCNLIATQQPTLSLTADSRVLQFASNSFDASIWECCMALMAGARLCLAQRASLLPGAILSGYLADQAISHVLLSPTALAAMDSLPDTLQTLLVGGEACPPTLVKRWSSGRQMLNAYGPTEITVCATLYSCASSDGSSADNPPPIGRPIANTRIYILDAHGQPVPRGVAGEIYIAGAGVARGYLNRPELTAERFLADPFSSEPDARMYRTGDLGRWLPDGHLDYLGRNDFQVKLRGFRIELGEIESRLTQCDGVREAVVIAREDETGQKQLIAYLRPEEGVELIPAELRQQLAQHLADYMLPSAFVTLEAFPLTPNGKLDRQALPAPDLSAIVTRGYEAPVGETEIALAQIWQDLLGLEQVGRHDHFFELGGHSLMIISLVEELRHLGWQIEVRSVFASPVLTDMALAIQHEASTFIVPPNLIPAGCTAITPEMLSLVSLSQSEINTIVGQITGGASNVQDIYPLAPLQEGILFHHLLQTQGDTYLLQSLLAFDSRNRLDSFLDALQQVINRHDILRTSVFWQGLEKPVQVVWRQAPLSVREFTPATMDAIPAQLQAYTDPHQHRINLNHAPLFAADIAHDPVQNEWLLALRFHHLVSDHMTLELILAEIAQILQGKTKTLPTMLPYRNFIAQTLSVPAAEHEAYFRAQLADIDEPTAPFGILSVPSDNRAIAEHRLPIDATLAKAIRSQARRLGVSPSILFHVGWAQVLAKTSGRDDVVFGSVLLGRLQGGAGANQILGMFINTLPLRISLNGRTVNEIVQETYHNLTALLEHEQAPLALAQRCSGVEQPIPLFSTLLNYRHSRPNTNDTVWDGIRPLFSEERTNYPLTLSVDDLGEDFSISVKAVATIDPARIADYLVATISGLTEALMNEPQQSVLALSILPATECQQLLAEFNTTEIDFPQNSLIHELFEQQAARTPEATAVIFEDLSFSFRELNCRANRLAHQLIAMGVRPDDRVALCVERSLEMMVGLLAILKAGGAYVPLDPAYPAERLAYMIDDAAPVALLTQSAFVEMLDSNLPSLLLDTQLPSIFDEEAENNPDAQALGLTPHHLAYVIYTSGSTGQPKGVMVTHRNVINLHTGLNAELALNSPYRIAMNASIVFDASVKIWLQLLSGHTLIIVPEQIRADSQQLWRYFAHHLVEMFDCTPVQLQWLLEAGLGTRAGYQPKLVLIGGDTIPLSMWSRLQDIETTRFINVYGPTECTVDATLCPIGLSLSQPSIGQPIANTQIYILDTQGQLLPLGVVGEIYIGGTGVARGYLNRPELTAERFVPNPFSTTPHARMYKTGDLGRWLPDGNIEYLGRNDFQVKLRGFRIELGEIESRLTQCDGVCEAVVIAREDKPGQKRLIAYLRPETGAELVPAELRQQLAQHLADYMVPSAFVTLDTFPLTPNGKLDRQALPAPDLSAFVARGYESPIGETENALAQIWQNLLGLERISRHDHFFELGGHSLLSVQLLNRMREQNMEISLTTLFAHPTLCDLAQAVKEHFVMPVSPFEANPVPLNPTGTSLPLFLVHETSGDPLVYSPLVTLLPPELPVYALQALGIHTLERPPVSIEELATCHIQAIRRIQPQGPYRLMGWSIGGLIAYEIAQQLISDGETIEFLGMIDSYYYAYKESGDFSTTTDQSVNKKARQMELLISALHDQGIIDDEKALAELHNLSNVEQVLDHSIEHQWLPAGITREDIFLRIYTAEIISQLGQGYIAQKSALPVHIYTAEESVNGDNWHGWHDIVGHDSVLHPIGGTHFSIMHPPLLNQIVDSITENLRDIPAFDPLVIIQQGSPSVSPLFCLPGAGASPSSLLELSLSFPQQLPIYVLQARGFTIEHHFPYSSVEGAARAYIQHIRQIQPHGPYHLLGHSFGGWIAFEIALQLQAEGERVSSLILIDTDEPDQQGNALKSVNRVETIMELIDIYNMILNQPLPLARQDFDDLAPDEQIQHLHSALVKVGLFPAKTPISMLQGIVRVMQANLNTGYIPRTRYEGLMHLINAEEGDKDERRRRETQWRLHVAELNTLVVPGNHMTMLSAPYVGQWVTNLWQNLHVPY